MVKIFVKQNEEITSLEISETTANWFDAYRQKNRVTVQQIADRTHNTYGSVSEKLIVHYLDSTASHQWGFFATQNFSYY